jgi:eukaryotic-like serine/threonine-protein kinase
MPLTVGDIVDDRYRILGKLGRGGMGEVYLAENVRIDRKVALKVLHAHFAFQDEIVVRFEREARAAARIGSPHVADVIDLGFLPSGERFVVMEYLEGESLSRRLKKCRTMTAKEVAPLALQLLEGLAEVHAVGIVHRDLKPGNIYLTHGKAGDVVKILDFGVSKFRSGLFSGPDSLTAQQDLLGTPAYMSPEHARGLPVDARSDIYSVGAVIYRCLAGVQPFSSENYLNLLLKITRERPRPLELLAPRVDPEFAAMVKKAMDRNADERFQSALEFRDAIAQWHGRVDRLLAEFLGLHHTASTLTRPKTPVPEPPPPRRSRLVSKVIVEPDELERSNGDTVDRQVDELLGVRRR